MIPGLLHNQFFGGGAVLMVMGAVMATLRQLPTQAAQWIRSRFTVSIQIVDRDPMFEWTKVWLDAHPYSKKARSLMCALERSDDEEFSAESRMLFTPAHGTHLLRHKGRWLRLHYGEEKPAGQEAPVRGARAPETITLTMLGTTQKPLRDLVAEITSFASAAQQKSRAYISCGGWWSRLRNFEPRRIETVDLPVADESLICSAIDDFLAARQLYAERGIPYHVNFLFEGLPGTGKTSLASALCGRFRLHLHLLNIAGPGMNDQRLVELMLNLPRRSMLLMEDVDALLPDGAARPQLPAPVADSPGEVTGKSPEAQGVTLSGLLNCMDGLTAPDGAVIVMTTNRPELIDPRLLRPGRVDYRVKFGAATREQIERMCKRLDPKRQLNGDLEWMMKQGYTTAQVQAEILRTGRS